MAFTSGNTNRITLKWVVNYEVSEWYSRISWKIRCFLRLSLRSRSGRPKTEIAGTLGLGKDAFSRRSRIRARKTQVRLRQMLEILNRVEAETGSALAAYAWFRAEPLPGFGGATPDLLLREGKADHVHACLDRIMAGGYA